MDPKLENLQSYDEVWEPIVVPDYNDLDELQDREADYDRKNPD